MSPVYALAAGALLAALTAHPWAFAPALLLPRGHRAAFLVGAGLVLLSLSLHPNPWQGRYGERLVLAGVHERGFLKSEEGWIYLDAYPRLPDGWVKVRGRVSRPPRARNPGGFDTARWLRGKGVHAVLREVELLEHRPLSTPRERARRRLVRGLSAEVAALARALVLGEREALGPWVHAFRRAGLAHLLALSGLHIGILAAFVLLILGWTGRARHLLTLAFLGGYLALVGPSPSLVRATLMAGVVLLFLFFGRGRLPLGPALASALALHLVLAPHAVFDLGFRLSYLAVAGLWLILPPLFAPFAKAAYPVRLLAGGVLATLAAQAATLPLVLDAFGRLPLLSPLANLLALPLVTLFLPLGLLKLLGLAAAAPLLELTGRALLRVASGFAPGPALTWGAIAPAGFSLYYLALAALTLALYRRLAAKRALFVVLLALLFSLAPRALGTLAVWQLDVGEGHATLMRAPGGVEVLVDTGPPWAKGRVVRALRALGVDELDLLVLTHPDRAHTGAALGLLAEVPVGAVLVGPAHPADDPALAAARLAGVPVLRGSRGARVELGPFVLDLLHPPRRAPEDPDAQSLVVRARWRGRAVLVLGDLPQRFEDELPAPPAEVVVAARHGRADGTGERLLYRLRPRLILVGSRRGPSPELRARARRLGAVLLSTHEGGALLVRLAPARPRGRGARGSPEAPPRSGRRARPAPGADR